MIEAKSFVETAKLAGFSLYTGVPCSYVKPFINYVIVGFLWKTLCEVLVMPITYRVIAILKKTEPTYAPAKVDALHD